jgi:hypothetical protein
MTFFTLMRALGLNGLPAARSIDDSAKAITFLPVTQSASENN